MPALGQNRLYVWDPFVRVFHWSLVVGFTIAYLGPIEPAPPPSLKHDREVLMAMPNGQACLRGQAAWWTSAISFDGIVSAKSASAGGRCGRFALSEGAMAEKPAAYFEGLDDGKLIVRVRYSDTEGKHEFRLVLPPRMPIGSHTVPLPDMARMELIRALGVLRELDERLLAGEDLPHLTSEE